jgi:hypothetical protein
MEARVFGFDGIKDVIHRSKKCWDTQTCGMYFAQNFRTEENRQLNTADIDAIDVIFVNNKIGFSKKFLEYQEALHFRGYLSSAAAGYAGRKVLFANDKGDQKAWQDRYRDARFLRLAMTEFKVLGNDRLFNIQIGAEVDKEALAEYDVHMHRNVFPPADRQNVREMSGDGHEKVTVRACGADEFVLRRRVGRPRANRAEKKRFTNGWFMISCPRDGRVISVVQQIQPENNLVKIEALRKIQGLYPACDCFIHDRNCQLHAAMERSGVAKQIKFTPIDKWHGAKSHSRSCKHHPLYVARLKKRCVGINTSVSEQVFSWFRHYARVFNNMRTERHIFLVLL